MRLQFQTDKVLAAIAQAYTCLIQVIKINYGKKNAQNALGDEIGNEVRLITCSAFVFL